MTEITLALVQEVQMPVSLWIRFNVSLHMYYISWNLCICIFTGQIWCFDWCCKELESYCLVCGGFRQLELFQELVLMKQLEHSENALYEKLHEKSNEKLDVDKQVFDAGCSLPWLYVITHLLLEIHQVRYWCLPSLDFSISFSVSSWLHYSPGTK